MEIFSITLLLLLHCSSIFCVKLTAIYTDFENKGEQEFFDIGKALTLKCKTDDEKAEISWKKNGEDVVEAFKDQTSHYQINNDGEVSKFYIQYTKAEDDGTYSCSTGDESKNFNVIAKAVVRVKPGDVAVVDGERLTLKCHAYGTDLEISWELPHNISDTDRVKYSDNEVAPGFIIKEGTLIIEHVKMSDRGTYKCIAQNGDDEATRIVDEAMVRIKDKYAALWPFIFICIEVFILCATILIYEKKRNKTEVDDSETDIAPETKNGKK